MFLGALLDLGLSRKELDAELAGLGVDYKLKVSKVARGAIAAKYVDVLMPGANRASKKASAKKKKAASNAPTDPHPHTHDDHTHSHPHPQVHPHAHPHAQHSHGKSYKQVRAIVEKAKLAAAVRERALAIFEGLAVAEGKVHGVAADDVHFHEVGAIDAIIDVTGAAIGLHLLGVERVT
ncbi:MAG: hypothetical protein ACJAYI_001594, partial [Myxococcota bacterium]